MTSEVDQDLLHALAQGGPEAVTALFRRHGAKMVTFARRYVPDRSTAEDVVIGLIGRWLERPPQMRDVEGLSTFLATSVYHASIDWMRRERAERGEHPRFKAGDTAPSPPRVASRDLRTQLLSALDKLSDDDRLLLETHYGRALTTEECMELLGITRAAFHQRLHRARVRLTELMSVEGDPA